jgi:V-type H+-transporting ATPase subunit E
VTLTHRAKDAKVVQKASKNASQKYKEMSGRSVEVKLESGLNDDEAGGIVGSAMGGKIKIDNTLGERLKLLEEKVSKHSVVL